MYLKTLESLKELVNQVLILLKEVPENNPCIQKINTAAETMLKVIDGVMANKVIQTSELSSIRHELRNPISAIKGYSELCLEDLSEFHDRGKITEIQKISATALEMLKLVESLKEESSPFQKEPLAEDSLEDNPFMPQIKGGKILIVDDVESNRLLLDNWLKRKNYTTVLAKSGPEALAILEQSQFDIVLLDIMMPEMDGFEVLQSIKSNERLAHLIVIMISAVDEMDSIVRCIKLGAMDYLIKPFDPYLLEARIIACLQNKFLGALYQERIIAHEKLAALENITAGIAHEIKNPLNFIHNFSTLSLELINSLVNLLKKIEHKFTGEEKKLLSESTETLKNNLEHIVKQSKQADEVIQRMFALSPPSAPTQKYAAVNVNKLIALAFEVVYEGFMKEFSVELIIHFEPNLTPVYVIQEKFFFVLINIFNNAFFALKKSANRPKIIISTKREKDHIKIEITDNGIGILEEDKAKIFTPFFTTKAPGKGVGLGLSLSHSIITQLHGGSLTFDSKANEFTTFTITLPISK